MFYNSRMNYITNNVRRKPSFEIWQYEYLRDLSNIYSIFTGCLIERYPDNNETSLKSEELFDKFCRMIYKKSSKFILKD